jgi:hypothetical protein
MGLIPYVMLVAILVGDLYAAHVINQKRRALDLSKPENVAQEKKLKMIILVVHVQSVVIAAVMLLLLKPMLIAAP